MGRAEKCACGKATLKRMYQRDANDVMQRTDWRSCPSCGAMRMDPIKKVKT